MLITDDDTLSHIGCIDPIAANGLLGFVDYGDTFLSIYFRWRLLRAPSGILTREKMPVVGIMQPRSAVLPGSLAAKTFGGDGVAVAEYGHVLPLRH
jgi:hypothetical protein